jgi:hypothetical protein
MVDLTDDTTVEDEYEMLRLDALPGDDLRNIAGMHQADQFDATDPYAERFSEFAGDENLLALSEEAEQ